MVSITARLFYCTPHATLRGNHRLHFCLPKHRTCALHKAARGPGQLQPVGGSTGPVNMRTQPVFCFSARIHKTLPQCLRPPLPRLHSLAAVTVSKSELKRLTSMPKLHFYVRSFLL